MFQIFKTQSLSLKIWIYQPRNLKIWIYQPRNLKIWIYQPRNLSTKKSIFFFKEDNNLSQKVSLSTVFIFLSVYLLCFSVFVWSYTCLSVHLLICFSVHSCNLLLFCFSVFSVFFLCLIICIFIHLFI